MTFKQTLIQFNDKIYNIAFIVKKNLNKEMNRSKLLIPCVLETSELTTNSASVYFGTLCLSVIHVLDHHTPQRFVTLKFPSV